VQINFGDDGVDWPAWIQAIGSLLGLFVAIGLGWVQFAVAARDRQSRLDAYLTAAIQTSNFTAYTIDQVWNALGKMQIVEREHTKLWSIHSMLEACETALAGFPLHEAPSGPCAQALIDILQQARHVRARVEAFINSDALAMQADFSQAADFAWKAVELLRSEKTKLIGSDRA